MACPKVWVLFFYLSMILSLDVFFCFMIVSTYQNSIKDCYPYICETKTYRDNDNDKSVPISTSCLTQVYYFSEKCLNNQTTCDKLLFKNCDKCGAYNFGCYEFPNISCRREGRFKCFHIGEINNYTDPFEACSLKEIPSECSDQDSFWNLFGFILIVMFMASILAIRQIYLLVYPVIKTTDAESQTPLEVTPW